MLQSEAASHWQNILESAASRVVKCPSRSWIQANILRCCGHLIAGSLAGVYILANSQDLRILNKMKRPSVTPQTRVAQEIKNYCRRKTPDAISDRRKCEKFITALKFCAYLGFIKNAYKTNVLSAVLILLFSFSLWRTEAHVTAIATLVIDAVECDKMKADCDDDNLELSAVQAEGAATGGLTKKTGQTPVQSAANPTGSGPQAQSPPVPAPQSTPTAIKGSSDGDDNLAIATDLTVGKVKPVETVSPAKKVEVSQPMENSERTSRVENETQDVQSSGDTVSGVDVAKTITMFKEEVATRGALIERFLLDMYTISVDSETKTHWQEVFALNIMFKTDDDKIDEKKSNFLSNIYPSKSMKLPKHCLPPAKAGRHIQVGLPALGATT